MAARKSNKKKGDALPVVAQKGNGFPEKELTAWLKDRSSWNHDDWLALLESLKQQGYSALVETQEGRDQVGMYLEANRK